PRAPRSCWRGRRRARRERVVRRGIGAFLSHTDGKAPIVGWPSPMSARPGVVYLVGSGPGDPGLLTLRAAQLLASADVVLHDRLVSRQTLALARAGAELVDVGKRPQPGDDSGSTAAQRSIEAAMIEKARAGRSVVRLKGGDPFVFGRGGEEAEALA